MTKFRDSLMIAEPESATIKHVVAHCNPPIRWWL